MVADIRIADDPGLVFEHIFRSLEARHPPKAEKDILDHLKEQFSLPDCAPKDASAVWASTLVKRHVAVEDVLSLLFDRLGPFVAMMCDIYDFLYRFISTTGGRTQHFELRSEGLAKPWSFDTSRMPHRITWIEQWRSALIEPVAVDWEGIGQFLRLDNGIFYGEVNDYRLVQSLMVDRRDGKLSPSLREMGDYLCSRLQHALSWLVVAPDSTPDAEALRAVVERASVLIPGLVELVGDNSASSYRLGVNVAPSPRGKEASVSGMSSLLPPPRQSRPVRMSRKVPHTRSMRHSPSVRCGDSMIATSHSR